ncbi:hypothetical protein D6789_02420 [Candidatus Woesearchaeota archaeon]|nr:MAG: hypothetical protein D6789_02420 [Candidatus Woesearchaeota archaeon]
MHEFTRLEGGVWTVGHSYGYRFKQEMRDFLAEHIKPNGKRWAYAHHCFKLMEEYAPIAAEFVRGEAAGADLAFEDAALLTLHEEICHQPHCTAFMVAPEATRDEKALLGQNWDWGVELAPHAGMLELHMRGEPAVLSYHYPGLWTSLGMNEHGVTLMWTGSGYFPELRPQIGVPTYALIAEALRRRTARDAAEYVLNAPNAGSFIFHIADPAGDNVVIEGIPGKTRAAASEPILTRATFYEIDEVVRLSKQVIPAPARRRKKRIHDALTSLEGAITVAAAQELLEQPPLFRNEQEVVTLDSFVAVPEERTITVRRGLPNIGQWTAYTL